MIARLAGVLAEKSPGRIIVDVQGVGYDVQVPLSTFYVAGEPGERVVLRVHTHVREDAILLFGFGSALEQTLFEKLIGVSGIGPKVALALLSGIEPAELVRAIRGSDIARLTRIPGVGRNTAKWLIVELRDRMPASGDEPETPAAAGADDLRDDLLSALANLGYQRGSVEKAVDKVLRGDPVDGFEGALRAVLKALAG